MQHILEPNIPIEEVFKRVRNTVYTQSGGTQVSWEHTSLIGTFCFNSGQLSSTSSEFYSEAVIKDYLYKSIDDGKFGRIILDLKSRNFYTQNPAITRFFDLESTTIDQEFLFGRNVLQAAQGGATKASNLILGLPRSIEKFDRDGENHILNGMLYEMYFNSYGSYRYGKIKNRYLNHLLKFVDEQVFDKSRTFIKNELLPFENTLLYIPGVNVHPIKVNLVLIPEDSWSGDFIANELIVYDKNILVDWEDLFNNNGDVYYEKIKKNDLESYIASKLFVPVHKLQLDYNVPIAEIKVVKFPDNKIVETYSSELK